MLLQSAWGILRAWIYIIVEKMEKMGLWRFYSDIIWMIIELKLSYETRDMKVFWKVTLKVCHHYYKL